MNKVHLLKLNDIISYLVFLALCSLMIRGSFYASFFHGLLFGTFFIALFIDSVKSQKINISEVALISVPFFLTLFGFLFSDDKAKALEIIFRSLPLLLIPFFYLKTNYSTIGKGYELIETYFPTFVLLILYSYIIIGFFLMNEGLGDYLYYSNFSQLIDIHPTYSGCIVNLGMLITIKKIVSLNRYLLLFYLMLFLILLIIIGSKISMFIGIVLSTYTIFKIRLVLFQRVILLLIPVVLIILSKPVLENRLTDKKLASNEKVEPMFLVNNLIRNDLYFRAMLWKSNINSLKGFELIIGKGTASKDEDRLLEYQINHLDYAVKNDYNAHNQFIEILYSYGVAGLLFFLVHCFFLVKKIVLSKQWNLLLIYVTFLIYFLFESMLIRSIGIIMYAFIITYIYINIKKSEQHSI